MLPDINARRRLLEQLAMQRLQEGYQAELSPGRPIAGLPTGPLPGLGAEPLGPTPGKPVMPQPVGAPAPVHPPPRGGFVKGYSEDVPDTGTPPPDYGRKLGHPLTPQPVGAGNNGSLAGGRPLVRPTEPPTHPQPQRMPIQRRSRRGF